MTVIAATTGTIRSRVDGTLYGRLILRCQPNDNGCWVFVGCHTPSGYGAIQINGKKVSTHRAMWSPVHGDISDGLCVCHRCDVRDCINPDHLFLGTVLDNNMDRASKNRSHRAFGEKNACSKVSDLDREKAVEDFAKGELASDIALRYGVIQGSVHGWLRKAGFVIKRPRVGERNGRSKLTADTVKNARQMLANGVSQMEVSRRFGVSGHTIWLIAHNKAWKT